MSILETTLKPINPFIWSHLPHRKEDHSCRFQPFSNLDLGQKPYGTSFKPQPSSNLKLCIEQAPIASIYNSTASSLLHSHIESTNVLDNTATTLHSYVQSGANFHTETFMSHVKWKSPLQVCQSIPNWEDVVHYASTEPTKGFSTLSINTVSYPYTTNSNPIKLSDEWTWNESVMHTNLRHLSGDSNHDSPNTLSSPIACKSRVMALPKRSAFLKRKISGENTKVHPNKKPRANVQNSLSMLQKPITSPTSRSRRGVAPDNDDTEEYWETKHESEGITNNLFQNNGTCTKDSSKHHKGQVYTPLTESCIQGWKNDLDSLKYLNDHDKVSSGPCRRMQELLDVLEENKAHPQLTAELLCRVQLMRSLRPFRHKTQYGVEVRNAVEKLWRYWREHIAKNSVTT
ncbi:hypothetical protein BDQ17DRAFT_1348893 [Cyathus striatus]|nr:hypothetical protein BDQ17DRAFT_1348893 [Cyathus striatus]